MLEYNGRVLARWSRTTCYRSNTHALDCQYLHSICKS